MKCRSLSRPIVFTVCFQLLVGDGALVAQQPRAEPIASLSARGEVYLDQLKVAGELTIFKGETLRTALDGVADLTIAKRGMLNIAPQTQISFEATPRYFATLDHGAIGLRSLLDAQNFQIRLGTYVVFPVTGEETAAAIERSSDGSSRVRCLSGSLGVIALEGSESVFLRPSEELTIPAGGPLPQTGVAVTQAPTVPPVPTAKRKSATPFIILGVLGGAAGAAAAALTRGGGGQPVSPSRP